MTMVWPVIVSVRHIVTTWSATSSLSAAFLSSEAAAACSICVFARFAVARDHIITHAPHLLGLGHIAGKCRGRNPELLDVARHAFGFGRAFRVKNRDMRAAPSQCLANALPQPAIAAGDNSNGILEIHD